MIPYYGDDFFTDIDYPSTSEAEEEARQEYFKCELYQGWCWIGHTKPFMHWLVECTRDPWQANEPIHIVRPISNNSVPETWGDKYYWRPRYFGGLYHLR